MMNNINKVLIVAAEPSGDELGAEFIQALRDKSPNIEIRGVGLDKMAQMGVKSEISLDGLAILGLVEALGAWKTAVKRADEVGLLAQEFKPDAAVLIDSWGFNLRAARAIKKYSPNTRLIKFVGPQVWATRAGRAKTLAKSFDEIWCIHDFELPYYDGLGIKTQVVGNPAIGRAIIGNKNNFLKNHNLDGNKIIGLLPGSRKKEITNVLPDFIEAAKIIANKFDDAVFVTIAAKNVREMIMPFKENCGFNWQIFDEDEKADAFASMDVAMACSGTVTTEIGLAGVPFCVGYRLDGLTFFIARNFLLKSKFVTLINVAADNEIAPEYLQGDLNAQNISNYILKTLSEPNKRLAQIKAQNLALEKMGRGSDTTAVRAANLLLK
ncbi:MAG: lipid-A-disaccharide synthase [Caulobacterales bacterium]|nr:lipid-A-disaccharide synthase [Caulobacterales bacterium]MCA0373162.1 lipid-A-disaccharide synthase [Pseudomonadota bacterium]